MADPMTRGSIGQELVLDITEGTFAYERGAAQEDGAELPPQRPQQGQRRRYWVINPLGAACLDYDRACKQRHTDRELRSRV
eukprot:9240633-Pyramimonas_sp.AAC.1